jgi:hypothetical protein
MKRRPGAVVVAFSTVAVGLFLALTHPLLRPDVFVHELPHSVPDHPKLSLQNKLLSMSSMSFDRCGLRYSNLKLYICGRSMDLIQILYNRDSSAAKVIKTGYLQGFMHVYI